jgi:release factor glutamine methyltransferase
MSDGVAWRTFATEAERRLREVGIESPDVDARRIVERASGNEGVDYFLGLDDPATERGVHYFDVMLERRLAGEPLQYVVGSWGFRQLDLLVDRRVLIPRPETEIVTDRALAELDRILADRPPVSAASIGQAVGQVPPEPRAIAADLGTGSGAIALSIAFERKGVEVWATAASADALDVATANLAGIGARGAQVRVAKGEWFAALPPELAGRLDLVVSNPPYVAEADELPPVVRDWEPTSALIAGPRGTEDLEIIVDSAGVWLAPGGALVVELAPDQAEPMAARARAVGFAEAEVFEDLTGRSRGIVARR